MQQCIAYIRVSTPKQGEKGVSLQEQRRAIEEYAARHSLVITQWFEEKETAAKQGRPAFSQMLAPLRKGKVSQVIIHKVDRGVRNLHDWADLGDLVDAGITVHIAGESLDLSSRGGRLSADMLAVVASDYIRNLREETKKGIYGRLRQGLLPMAAYLGYCNNGPGKPKTIDPVRGPLIRQGFELYATGRYSFYTLREELTARGLRGRNGKPISLNSLSLILNNPFYMGLIRIKKTGETFAGVHEPLVSARLFKAVQEQLRGKTQVSMRQHFFPFRQLARCALCGRTLSGETQKGHIYYRCHGRTCPLRCLREDTMHEAVWQELVRVSLTEEERQVVEQMFKREERRSADRQHESKRALELQLSQTKDRLMRLTDAYVDRDIDRSLFEARKVQLLVEEKDLEDKLANPKSAADNRRAVEALFERGNTASLSYLAAPPEEQRSILQETTSNLEASPDKLSVRLSFPYSLIADRASILSCCPQRDGFRTRSNVPEAASVSQYSYLEELVQRLLEWVRRREK